MKIIPECHSKAYGIYSTTPFQIKGTLQKKLPDEIQDYSIKINFDSNFYILFCNEQTTMECQIEEEGTGKLYSPIQLRQNIYTKNFFYFNPKRSAVIESPIILYPYNKEVNYRKLYANRFNIQESSLIANVFPGCNICDNEIVNKEERDYIKSLYLMNKYVGIAEGLKSLGFNFNKLGNYE